MAPTYEELAAKVKDLEESDRDAKKHMEAMREVLGREGVLVRLPKATICHFLGDGAEAAEHIHAEIQDHQARCDNTMSVQQEHFPRNDLYAGYIQDVQRLSELRYSAPLAIPLLLRYAKHDYKKNLTGLPECHMKRARVIDRIALASVIAYCRVSNDWLESSLEIGVMLSGIMERRAEIAEHFGRGRLRDRSVSEIRQTYVDTGFFPETVMYLRQIHARNTARTVLNKVVASILPPELVDLIEDVCYDKNYTDSAPDKAKLTEGETVEDEDDYDLTAPW